MNTLEITSPEELWSWLAENHETQDSIRLITWKVAHPDKYVGREEVLDALVAHGWIDGRRFVVDCDRTAQLISRRKQQAWSKTYKDRAERLQREKRMHFSGVASVMQGRSSGLWDFYSDVDALVVPDDLAAILDFGKWEELAPSYKRNVLRWIKLAKTPETRSRRVTSAACATREQRKLPQM